MEGDTEQPAPPFWLREDRELRVAAHERQTQKGEQEIGCYLRTITQGEVVFTCTICAQTCRREQYPGPTPRYCSDICRTRAEREAAAARMRRLRRRRAVRENS